MYQYILHHHKCKLKRYDTRSMSNKKITRLNWTSSEIKNFCASMDNTKKAKEIYRMEENVYKLYIWQRFRIYKELLQLDKKKTNNVIWFFKFFTDTVVHILGVRVIFWYYKVHSKCSDRVAVQLTGLFLIVICFIIGLQF